MNLYLCGFQGVGKTFFGKMLQEIVQAPFHDADEQFLELEGGNLTTIRDLYTTLGKERFRKKEEKIIQEIVKKGRSIVALGGGSFASPLTQTLVAKTGMLVYLMIAKERLVQKLEIQIAEGHCPAYLDAHDPFLSFEKLYSERHALFSKYAHIIIDIEQNANSEVLDILKNIWEQKNGQ